MLQECNQTFHEGCRFRCVQVIPKLNQVPFHSQTSRVSQSTPSSRLFTGKFCKQIVVQISPWAVLFDSFPPLRGLCYLLLPTCIMADRQDICSLTTWQQLSVRFHVQDVQTPCAAGSRVYASAEMLLTPKQRCYPARLSNSFCFYSPQTHVEQNDCGPQSFLVTRNHKPVPDCCSIFSVAFVTFNTFNFSSPKAKKEWEWNRTFILYL